LSDSPALLEIRNLHKRFRGLHAINDVSLSLSGGKTWSLIGPNGAGKTTLFNLITGTLQADSGKIEFMGTDITSRKPYEICRLGITRTYQHKNLFANLSVADNIAAGMMKDSLSPGERGEATDQILELLGIRDKARAAVSGLTPLDSKLVELGRALATRPRLILLDELIGGLLPSETEKMCEIIELLKQEGHTIFQIGHEMGPIMKTSDWVFVLDEGRRIAAGTPAEIRNNQEVHDVYLE